MSVAITPSNVLAWCEQHMDKYGEMMKDKMQDAERATEMMKDIADAQKTLASWRANDSDTVLPGHEKSVQQEALEALEALKEKYPELAGALDDFIEYGKAYKAGANPGQCNAEIDSIVKLLDDVKDQNGKHDQLLMLEINDLHAQYQRAAEQANQFLAAQSRTLDTIVKNMGA